MKFLLQILLVMFVLPAYSQMPRDPFDPVVNNPVVNDFPYKEVQNVVNARANYVNLRWVTEQSRIALILTVDSIREDFRASVEMQDAIRNQESSYNRYIAERERVLASVKKDANYQALRSMSDNLKIKIEQLNSTNADIRGYADLRLSYSSRATRIENDALNNDLAFQSAKQKLVNDAAHVQQLQSAFNRNIRYNPRFVEARNTFSNLTVAYISSGAYLESAYEARNIALRYSYMLHRYDQYRYSTPYWGGIYHYPYRRW